jgi:ubiquinone/menaquinone biosynthesis C-methylase UbiE
MPVDARWNHNAHYYRHALEAMPRPCRTALDVGCGDGTLVGLLADRADHVVGIDPDAVSIRAARERHRENDRVSFVEGDFLIHDFGEQRFDFVTCVAALHHMALESVVERLATVLRPGGTLYVIGLAKSSRVGDLLYDGVGMIASRAVRLRRGWWSHGSPELDPTETYTRLRRTLHDQLPGCVFHRRIYFRYTAEWTRP